MTSDERIAAALEGIQAELKALREQLAEQYADPKVILTGFLVKQGSTLIGPDGMPLVETKPLGGQKAGH